jgi:hypothetical protein
MIIILLIGFIKTIYLGIVARTNYDKRWVSTRVTCIQNLVRRMIAIGNFKTKKIQLNDAVLILQKKFRSWVSLLYIHIYIYIS